MSMETDLVTVLDADGTLSGLIGTRLYNGRAEQGETKPYVTFHVIDRIGNFDVTGPTGFVNPTVQFDVWADTTASRSSVREALIGALDDYRGDDTVDIRKCWFTEKGQDTEEDPGDGSETPVFRSRLELEVVYRS